MSLDIRIHFFVKSIDQDFDRFFILFLYGTVLALLIKPVILLFPCEVMALNF